MILGRNPPYTWVSARDHGNPVTPGQKRPRAALSQPPYHNGGSPEPKRQAIPRRAHRGWRMGPSTPIPRGPAAPQILPYTGKTVWMTRGRRDRASESSTRRLTGYAGRRGTA